MYSESVTVLAFNFFSSVHRMFGVQIFSVNSDLADNFAGG